MLWLVREQIGPGSQGWGRRAEHRRGNPPVFTGLAAAWPPLGGHRSGRFRSGVWDRYESCQQSWRTHTVGFSTFFNLQP